MKFIKTAPDNATLDMGTYKFIYESEVKKHNRKVVTNFIIDAICVVGSVACLWFFAIVMLSI